VANFTTNYNVWNIYDKPVFTLSSLSEIHFSFFKLATIRRDVIELKIINKINVPKVHSKIKKPPPVALGW
jgi:hypothetical protein